MNIIKIWPSFQTELKYHDHYLSEIMQEHGVETTFLSSDKIDGEFLPFLNNKEIKAGEDSYKGSKIIRLKSIEVMRKPFITEIGKLYRELCTKNYNLIHIFGIGNPVTILTLAILKLCNKKLPVIISDHSNPNLKNMSVIGSMYYKTNIFLFSKLNAQVELVVTPNLASSDFIQHHYGLKKERMKIIPLGYDSDVFSCDSDVKNLSNSLVVGFAGKVLPGKKLELLLDVLSEINNNDIVCEIVGFSEPETEYQQGLRAYAKTCGVNVSFKPLIRDAKKLAGFYNYIDLAVFPGSISITTLEANGCGTPVILYRSIEGLEDRVIGDRGYLFSTKEEFRKYILYYKKMKENKLVPNIKIEEQSRKYSWQEISNTYLDLYKSVCDS